MGQGSAPASENEHGQWDAGERRLATNLGKTVQSDPIQTAAVGGWPPYCSARLRRRELPTRSFQIRGCRAVL